MKRNGLGSFQNSECIIEKPRARDSGLIDCHFFPFTVEMINYWDSFRAGSPQALWYNHVSYSWLKRTCNKKLIFLIAFVCSSHACTHGKHACLMYSSDDLLYILKTKETSQNVNLNWSSTNWTPSIIPCNVGHI